MGLVGKLAYKLEGLDKIAIGNLIDILESAKDDIIEEGRIDRERFK
jgi:hypothetical protein